MLSDGTSPLSVSDDYVDDVFDLNSIDLEEIATALADQSAYEHRWLIDPHSGAVVFWTSDTGIDGRTPVDLDELDLIAIDPLASHVWYEDMADFAELLSNERAGQRLSRAIAGRGAFRRFKDELHQEYADLVPTWNAFRDVRALRRAVEWLATTRSSRTTQPPTISIDTLTPRFRKPLSAARFAIKPRLRAPARPFLGPG